MWAYGPGLRVGWGLGWVSGGGGGAHFRVPHLLRVLELRSNFNTRYFDSHQIIDLFHDFPWISQARWGTGPQGAGWILSFLTIFCDFPS